jgi:hypothetical protein
MDTEAAASQIAGHIPVRWQIETCFKHLKSNDFHLKSMRIQGKARQPLMMAVVVFAYVISILEGLKTYKQVGKKKFADGTVYKQEPLFRHGLDHLIDWFRYLFSFSKYLVCITKSKVQKGKPIFVQ